MGLPLVGAYLRGIPFGGPKQLGISSARSLLALVARRALGPELGASCLELGAISAELGRELALLGAEARDLAAELRDLRASSRELGAISAQLRLRELASLLRALLRLGQGQG